MTAVSEPRVGGEPMPANWIERHPKAVALSLLGLLLACAVASGLWIFSLRSTIRHQKEVLAAREAKAREEKASLEESRDREVTLLKHENAELRDQVTTLRRTARELSASLAKVTSLLNETTGSPANASAKAELDKAMGQLSRNSDEMNQAVDRLDSAEPHRPETQAEPATPSEPEPRSPSVIPLVTGGIVAALGLLGFGLYLYRKNQELERKEIRLNQREQRLKMPKPRPEVVSGQG